MLWRLASWLAFPILLALLASVVCLGGWDVVGNSLLAQGYEDGDDEKALGDFCCCTVDEIRQGTERITQLLNNISRRPFFRFFKVNLEKECPYWAVQYLCTSEDSSCQICSCDANNVPDALKYPHDMSDPTTVDSRVAYGEPHPGNVDGWGIWKVSDDDLVYVDLLQNPEANTGYSGPMASRVWNAIYENCVIEAPHQGEPDVKQHFKERNFFKKLISGLHTSIAMHVAAFFYKDKHRNSPLQQADVLSNPNLSFYPNCEMYRRIVKNGEFVNNLYILYQFILRALVKSKPSLLANLNEYNSGANGEATEEDYYLHTELQKLFDTQLMCSATFDEGKFFESPKAHKLVLRMKQMMWNVTTLMDCVTCEKCRLWGKLQTMGLSTAFKVVMLSSTEVMTLSRGEKVSLVNFARQLSISVKNIGVLDDICQQEKTVVKS